MGVESGIIDTGISAVHPMALADSARVSIYEQRAVGSAVRAFPVRFETGTGTGVLRTEVQLIVDIAFYGIQRIEHQDFAGRIFGLGKHPAALGILGVEKVSVQPSAAIEFGAPCSGIRKPRTFPEFVHFLIAGNHEFFGYVRSDGPYSFRAVKQNLSDH